MFDLSLLKPAMEVVDHDGIHVGTIASVEDRCIRLTRGDSVDGLHHFIYFDSLDRVDDDRVLLTRDAQIPVGVR